VREVVGEEESLEKNTTTQNSTSQQSPVASRQSRPRGTVSQRSSLGEGTPGVYISLHSAVVALMLCIHTVRSESPTTTSLPFSKGPRPDGEVGGGKHPPDAAAATLFWSSYRYNTRCSSLPLLASASASAIALRCRPTFTRLGVKPSHQPPQTRTTTPPEACLP
jgi:hypothetical protein